ncbi:hypothetical protein JOM56_000765 [Amanita muscaria]
MPTYEIHIFMTKEEVKELSDKEYSLCFAKAIIDPSSLANDPVAVSDVVTASYEPKEWGPNDTLFKWSDNYSIAARSTAYKQGDVIKETGSDVYPVVLKDLLVVENWADIKVQPNSKVLKPGEFGYNPADSKFPGVSILYVQAEPKGKMGNPCYTSAHIINGGPNNVEHLEPVAAADVYFGYKAQTGSVKVQTILYPAKLVFEGGKNNCKITLQKTSGDWKIEYS